METQVAEWDAATESTSKVEEMEKYFLKIKRSLKIMLPTFPLGKDKSKGFKPIFRNPRLSKRKSINTTTRSLIRLSK